MNRHARIEIVPGVFAHRTRNPAKGICDDCGADMRAEPMRPCSAKPAKERA